MKIAAGILEYMDNDSLMRCLESLRLGKGGIDTAFVIHGPLMGVPPSLQQPCDPCTMSIIFAYGARAVNTFRPPLIHFHNNKKPVTEIEARNQYMKMASDRGYDWLLVIDSDEYITSNVDWDKFREQLDYIMSLRLPHQIFDVMFEGTTAQRGPRPRLFYRPGTIKYWKRHFWWVLEETKTCYKGTSDAGRIIDGIYIIEDKSLRDAKYANLISVYKEWQETYEGLAAAATVTE